MLRDTRYAIVQLVRRPAFSAVAVLTLALGIGANTAIFSAVHAVLLTGPPFPAADELRLVTQTLRTADGAPEMSFEQWSYPEYERFREAASRVATAAYTPFPVSFNMSTDDEPAAVGVEFVSGSYFGILGVSAQEGRTLAPIDDTTPGAHPVAVISYRIWQSVFASGPGVVGRTVRLDGIPLEIIGIMPADFAGLTEAGGVFDGADIWVPMMMAPTLWFETRLQQPRAFWHNVVARISDDETPLAAAELASGSQALSQDFAATIGRTEIEFAFRSLGDAWVNRPFGTALLILLAAVTCVLLITCVNLANLLLARGVRRARDFGLRMALGANSLHLVRQSLAEAVVLSILGGAAALVVAMWGLALVRGLDPGVLPASGTEPVFRLSIPALAFNASISFLAAFVFGIAPAIAATRHDPRSLLSGATRGYSGAGPRRALVVAEVALATILLIGAGLFLRSLNRLEDVPLGFQPDDLFAAYINPPEQAYSPDQAASLLMEAASRISARPGIESAVIANCLPANPSAGPLAVTGLCDQGQMRIQGESDTSPSHDVSVNMVSAGYFRTLGIPVLEGRSFEQSDRPDTPPVAIVTRSAANRYWPGGEVVGETIQLSAGTNEPVRIVGIVGDTVGASPLELSGPGVYLPYPQSSYTSNYLVVRSADNPNASASVVRSVLLELDSTLPLWDVATMTDRVTRMTARDRFTTVLLGVFALIALLLAASGIYGVLAFRVAERMREMGIRIAVGATGNDVSRLVLRDGLGATLTGLVLGVVMAAALGRLLENQLYNISTLNPATFVSAGIVLLAVAGIACFLPSRRASRVDPMVTLRHE